MLRLFSRLGRPFFSDQLGGFVVEGSPSGGAVGAHGEWRELRNVLCEVGGFERLAFGRRAVG